MLGPFAIPVLQEESFMLIGRKQSLFNFVSYLALFFIFSSTSYADEKAHTNPTAIIDTNLGQIKLELYQGKAPKTVSNFIQYAKEKFYDNTIFHRVIPNFMIQGGGFDSSMKQKATRAPIINEANPFVPNKRGTIAMARTANPDSATAQFFINVENNLYLNKSSSSAGYAVFGHVLEGMEVADKIALAKTGIKYGMRDVPVDNVIIKSIVIKQ